jgi:hypothetical protein
VRVLRRLTPALAVLAALVLPSAALAGLPREFSVFYDCPVNDPAVGTCVVSTVNGGEFKLGSKSVAIDKTIVLQGGIGPSSTALVPAADGNTLSRTPLTVPGGLVGIEGLGGEVTATAELAGTVNVNETNLLRSEGTAVGLPLQVKLDNPALGESCYIGSGSSPVAPQLTTGTTSPPGSAEPISGKLGTIGITGAGKIDVVSGTTLVDNAFSVPGANGCGGLLSLLIDPTVDLDAGIPSPAGSNVAILEGTLETAGVKSVRVERELPEIGRCTKAPSSKEGTTTIYHGGFTDSGCVIESPSREGKYEWANGPGAARRFSGLGGTSVLETVSKHKIVCEASSASGEYTGAKTATAVLRFAGCVTGAAKEPCRSAGASAGEIVTSPLTGQLGFVKDEFVNNEMLVSVGLDLGGTGTLVSGECAGVPQALSVTGQAIAPISAIDKPTTAFALKLVQRAGVQAPERFEEGPLQTLSASISSSPERAGLKAALKLTNEERLEIKAEEQE